MELRSWECFVVKNMMEGLKNSWKLVDCCRTVMMSDGRVMENSIAMISTDWRDH